MIAIVVAMSENRVIGRDNSLPWHLPADLKHFKSLTMGHPIIMGRKTFESIGKPLGGRTNIIVTRQEDYPAEGCLIAHSIAPALEKAKEIDEQVFVIGGAEVFKGSMPLVDTLFLTYVHAEVEGDVYFPELNPQEWEEADRERHEADEKHAFGYSFVRMVRSN
jgi:dihydrofolate reductase